MDIPVNWITRGTSNTSCNHLPSDFREDKSLFSRNKTNFVNMKGIRCPRCMLSLLGPRPV